VQVTAVTQTTIRRIVNGDGALFPRDQASIVPKIAAPVQRFYVNRGDHVRKGQLLAVLENGDLRDAADESKGTLEQAESNLRTTQGATVPEAVSKAQTDLEAASDARASAKRALENYLAANSSVQTTQGDRLGGLRRYRKGYSCPSPIASAGQSAPAGALHSRSMTMYGSPGTKQTPREAPLSQHAGLLPGANSVFTFAANVSHACRPKVSFGPSVSLLSRTSTRLAVVATSVQLPPPLPL